MDQPYATLEIFCLKKKKKGFAGINSNKWLEAIMKCVLDEITSTKQ